MTAMYLPTPTIGYYSFKNTNGATSEPSSTVTVVIHCTTGASRVAEQFSTAEGENYGEALIGEFLDQIPEVIEPLPLPAPVIVRVYPIQGWPSESHLTDVRPRAPPYPWPPSSVASPLTQLSDSDNIQKSNLI